MDNYETITVSLRMKQHGEQFGLIINQVPSYTFIREDVITHISTYTFQWSHRTKSSKMPFWLILGIALPRVIALLC